MKENRITYVDIARSLAIIFIILGHIYVHSEHCSFLFKFLYSFHVALFFIISGYTFKVTTDSFFSFLKKKFKRIIIPYLFWAVFFLVPFLIFGKNFGDSLGMNVSNSFVKSLISILYGVGSNSALRQNTSLWFLPALFSIEIFYNFIIKFTDGKKNSDYIILLVALFISVLSNNLLKFILPFGLNTMFEVGIFFYVGYLMNKNKFIHKLSSYHILILFILGIVFCKYNTVVSFIEYNYGNLIFAYFSGLFFSICVLWISYKINSNYILEYIGKNTMGILIFHKIIIVIFQTKMGIITQLLNDSNLIVEFLLSLVVCFGTLMFSLIINDYLKLFFPQLLGTNSNGGK